MKKTIKICPVCSNEFTVNTCHESRYTTCGRKCGGLYRRKLIITNNCLFCNKEFISKKTPTKSQSYCSRLCGQKSLSKRIGRTCLFCNKTFYVIPSLLTKSGGGTYCCQLCRVKDLNNKSIKAQCPGSYRENAWKVFEKKCYDCFLTDDRVLVIHHIDGNRKNGLISNLIPVCHNCHCLRHIKMSGDGRISSYRGRD